MLVLDEQIKKANDAVFDVEEKAVLRKVIINKNTALLFIQVKDKRKIFK